MSPLIDWSAQIAAVGGWPALAALAALGFFVGGLTGLFGVGGAFLITPMLMVLFGVSESVAVGSGLCFIIGTSAAGLARHWRHKGVAPRTAMIVGAGSVVGTLLGTALHTWLKHALGAGGGFDFPVMVRLLYLVLLPLAGYLAVHGAKSRPARQSFLQRLPLPPHITVRAAGIEHVSLPGLVLMGLGVGVLTGLMGVGGGVLYMPLLLVGVGMSAQQAVGTSIGVVLISAIAGTANHGALGNVNLVLAVALLVGSTLGVQVGAHLCHRLQAKDLGRYFAVIVGLAMAVLAADLAIKALAPWRSPTGTRGEAVQQAPPPATQRDHGQIQGQISTPD